MPRASQRLCAPGAPSRSARRYTRRSRPAAPLAAALFALGGAAPLASGAIPSYTLVGSFALPAGEWDIVPAGPLAGRVLALQGTSVVVQSALNAGTYDPIGSVPAGSVASFGASFVSVSPSGTRLAFGDNAAPGPQQRVHFVNIAALNTSAPTATASALAFNFAADWADDTTLYVSGARDFVTQSVLTRVNADTLTSQVVVDNVGDASGGVAVYANRVFVGSGLNLAVPSDTGNVRAFNLPALAGAAAPVAFTSGTLVADLLSASPLDFDAWGNLLAGGGEFGNPAESGFASVYDRGSNTRLNLAPAGSQFYGVRYNAVTQELLVSDPYGTGLVYRYAVPAPQAAFAVFAGGGVLGARRRRHG